MALAHHAGGLRAAGVSHARAGRSPAVRGGPVGLLVRGKYHNLQSVTVDPAHGPRGRGGIRG